MEVYTEVENDACDAYPHDATAAGTAGYEHEEPGYNMQMVRHIEEEEDADRSDLINMGVFKPTSGNATKRLRVRQETRGRTRITQTAEATLKQIASQEFQAEKGKMQVWKQMIMKEVALELQTVKELAEAQRVEVEGLKGQLQEMELKSASLEKEIGLLKVKEQESGQQLGKSNPAMRKNQTQPTEQRKSPEYPAPPTRKGIHPEHNLRSETTTPPPYLGSAINTPKQAQAPTRNQDPVEEYATPSSSYQVNPTKERSYASVAATQPTQSSSQPWTEVKYGSRKNGTPKVGTEVKFEQRGRKILFLRQNDSQLKSEADMMLALNEALQKAGIETKVRFSRVRYAPSGSISALLTEKADATMLIPSRSNLLIRAAKSVDNAIVGVEVFEQWQRRKVHGMRLDRYIGLGKMELLKREVESSTGISLKATPRWLISEDRLKEQQAINNKRGSAIVITVSNKLVAKQLIASGLRFRGMDKKVEKFWKAGPGSVCLRCYRIGYERLEKCGNRPEKCVMCAGEHQVNEHECGVIGCNKGKGKLYIHVMV